MSIADQGRLLYEAGASIMHTLATFAAPTPSPEPKPDLDTNGIMLFFTSKIVPILLAALGVIFIGRASKGEMSRVLTSSAIAIIGLVFIGGATVLFFFGKSLVSLIFGTA